MRLKDSESDTERVIERQWERGRETGETKRQMSHKDLRGRDLPRLGD